METNGYKLVWKVWARFTLLYVIVSAVLRIVLCLHPLTVPSSLGFWQWIEVFVMGAINDTCVVSVLVLPLIAFLMSTGHWKLHRPQCWAFLAVLALLWLWVAFGWKTLHEFNKPFARILGYVVLYWLATFVLRAFVPALRRGWMLAWTSVIIFIYMVILTMNTCGEWFFWNEFGVRYNFIAVDYLIYTNEVVGNIMQSYSMGWIITGVVVISLALEYFLFRDIIAASANLWRKPWRLKGATVLVPAVAGVALLPLTAKLQQSDNVWSNQLQASGPYSFIQAFMDNNLDYRKFYITLADDKADAIVSASLRHGLEPAYTDTIALGKLYPNIVLVTMESVSADYMRRFGREEDLTPTLDSLWHCSLAFDRMFAAGNRTVRGLEALTLSRPPAPGESLIKRPDGKAYPSIAESMKEMGYECRFYYGGDSYFDNMEQFFTNLGYEIRDRKTMADADVTCQTIWGVCDGDIYRRVLADLDKAYADSSRVFTHVLTTSNHRPYIYPEGCISIPPSKKSRKGGVMYSDYALGEFLREASKRPWHANTVYVISADHCASSAGSTELPLANYHIPALIYAPGLIAPEIVDATASQVDLMPTMMARLNWPLDTALYGRDILSPTYESRAYLATYQDLGYYQGDTLTVLSPGRKVRQFSVTPTAENPLEITPVNAPDQALIDKAAAYYQISSSTY